VVLTGARQTGKTSLARRLFPRYHFVSLDLPSEAETAEQDSRNFLSRHPAPLIIDEVQYAPKLFRALKVAVDENRSQAGRFLLTGSQRFVLMKGISESLAGRAEIVELDTLSSVEIRKALPDAKLDQVLLRGGFPELWANPEVDAYSYYRSYIATYLERDVRSLLGVASLRDFERFLRACAVRTAQLLNKSDLARDVGISPSTANEWLSVLNTSGQVVLVEPWFANRTKSIGKRPKLYFADTGLLCALLDLRGPEGLAGSPFAGALWETFVFGELRKREIHKQLHWSIHFWQDRSREVDFLIHRGGRFELYEAKWAEHPDRRTTENMLWLTEQFGKNNIIRRDVVCRAPQRYPIGNGVYATPVEEL